MPALALLAVLIVLIGVVTVLLLTRDTESADPVADDQATATVGPQPTVDPLLPVVSNPPASAAPTSSTTAPVSVPIAPSTAPFGAAGPTTTPQTTRTSVLASTTPSATPTPTSTTAATTAATTTTTTTTTTTATTATTITATTVTVAPSLSGIVLSEPSTVTGSNGERLTVTPRRGTCGSGPDCFIASFTIEGFRSRPTEFVCEFSSGRRDAYRFDGASVDPACSSVDIPESFVIEVGDLRSDPVTIERRG